VEVVVVVVQRLAVVVQVVVAEYPFVEVKSFAMVFVSPYMSEQVDNGRHFMIPASKDLHRVELQVTWVRPLYLETTLLYLVVVVVAQCTASMRNLHWDCQVHMVEGSVLPKELVV
jgi:hypothetical protein